MRRKRNLNVSDDEPVLDISSLIDICFLLLIYFIVTSTIQPREQDLPMTLPDGSKMPGDEVVKVLIVLKGDGSIVMNTGADEEILDTDISIHKIPKTKERLRMLGDLARSTGTELLVQIASEEGVIYQRFVDVLSCLKGEGLNKIAVRDL